MLWDAAEFELIFPNREYVRVGYFFKEDQWAVPGSAAPAGSRTAGAEPLCRTAPCPGAVGHAGFQPVLLACWLCKLLG